MDLTSNRVGSGRSRTICPRESQVCILSLMSPRNDLQGANSLDSERMRIRFQTHCPRHRAPLIERCAVCFVEDPLLPNANAFSPIPSCWKCGSALFSYDADERASSIVAEIISLESAILELMTGRPPNRTWARLSPDPAFVEKLRILIEDLTTPTDEGVFTKFDLCVLLCRSPSCDGGTSEGDRR
jgi:hypothetical protein